ncbi:sigma-E processing peptidase SpoIIGA [Bacillus aerolatus]|uniref:Sporulation sigma-E factor-processing peptidase n=1 Tax=Bacillus aerolatus TaxID=2653354 RepID=A0A6I1FHT9_9BACI|nr:sigma-E processing peptidase SpoIIGA [Bacillus aerolatus]KAB7707977.1 sigma-E processing peptidase SpoIIGA [Bacillus aerolatus]
MVLYLDALWLLNLLADSLLLWMTAIFLKRSVKWRRLAAGGLVGSASILLMVTPIAEAAGHPLAKVALSAIMVFAAFGFKRWKYFFVNLMTFYFSTFLTGGMLLGAHYFIRFDMQMESAVFLAGLKGFGDPVSWIFVMFGLPAASYFAKSRADDFETAQLQHDQLLDVKVEINGAEFLLKGLVDTGNQLHDPISKAPVMFISIIGLEEQLPDEIVKAADNPDILLFQDEQLPEEWLEKMRLIPAKSVGKAHQLLPAFKPDQIEVSNGTKKAAVPKALVSFTSMNLSSDEQFSCILHPKMVLPLSFEEVS